MIKKKLKIFDIQRFSLHDGPGIRTTVFLKGCPLHCPWCSNPESQDYATALMYLESKCSKCGRCAAACPHNAIDFSKGGPEFNRKLCRRCGSCAEACLNGAVELSGREAGAEEIISIVCRDRDYYQNTGGGLTVSGGEPLCQPQGLYELLAVAKERGISTALETTGNAPRAALEQVLPLVDLFLFDMKHPHREKLKSYTGADLELVLDNLSLCAKLGQVIVRIPVIPGFNNSREELGDLFRLVAKAGVDRAELLPYHVLGRNKYAQLGSECPYGDEEALDKASLRPYIELGKEYGVYVAV